MTDIALAGASTVSPAFDYAGAGLAPDVVTQAHAAALRIRKRTTTIQTAILESGQDLIWAKEAIGHGHFIAWLNAEVGMSPSTAKRYMDVAENLDPKFVTVTNLPPALLYALAAPTTPKELRDEVVQEQAAGKPVDPTMVRAQIADARRAAADEAEQAKKTPEARKREQARVERQRREHEASVAQHRAEEEADNQSAEEALAFLRERLGDDFGTFLGMIKGQRGYVVGSKLHHLANDRLRNLGITA